MGKILYVSDVKYEEEFWEKIFLRKNQIIHNRDEYVRELIDDIGEIEGDPVQDIDNALL